MIDRSTAVLFAVITIFMICSNCFCSDLVESESEIFLESIPTVLPPEIQDNVVKYTIFFVFEKCPQEQWAYFNGDSNQLVLDFYGVYISKSPTVTIKGSSVLHSFSIKNYETNLSISGKRSQIILNLDSFWHYQTSIISEKVLKLEIWKTLNPSKVLKKEEHAWVFPVITLIASIAGAALTIGMLAIFASPE
jgi:hypothetical protein